MVSPLHILGVMGINDAPRRWPDSSGRWNPRTVIISGDPRHHAQRHADALVVRTNLELISQLEDPQSFVVAVVLAGQFAHDRELAAFLTESYPGLRVIAGTADLDPKLLAVVT